jgi:hypothetical protein
VDDGNLSSIIIALIALVTLTITLFGGAIIYFAKWFSRNYGNDMRAHTKAAVQSSTASTKLSKAVDKNTASNESVLTFMKALNGKLAKATIQTVQEQHVEHQVVEKQE